MLHSPDRSAIKKLFALSGNRCAFPRCNERIIDSEYKVVVGEICHIKGRSKGAARYDPNQTADERNGFDNLIIMCPKHHKIIDENPDKFPVSVLMEMKKKHESRVGIKEVIDNWVIESIIKNE